MGAAAEHALYPNDARNFTIGEGLFIPGIAGATALRSMVTPQTFSDPDHNDRKVPCSGTPRKGTPPEGNDYCGVHSNSGIPNRAFSLTVSGGSLYDFAAGRPVLRPVGVPTGIGWDMATEITYWATTGLSPTANFENAALAQIAEAAIVGGAPAVLTVTCAWYSVGVFTPAVESDTFVVTPSRRG